MMKLHQIKEHKEEHVAKKIEKKLAKKSQKKLHIAKTQKELLCPFNKGDNEYDDLRRLHHDEVISVVIKKYLEPENLGFDSGSW